MSLQTITLRTTLTLLILGLTFAQSRAYSPDSLLARLSYGSGRIIDWRQEQGNPQICFALYRNGYYQVSRLTEGGPETLQGTLSEDEAVRFRSMLGNLDFQSSGGGVILNSAEVLEAEVVRKGKTMHYIWIDPDHERPFPKSAMSIVKWLHDFKPEGASPLTVRELSDQPSICPVASQPMLPLFRKFEPSSGGPLVNSRRCRNQASLTMSVLSRPVRAHYENNTPRSAISISWRVPSQPRLAHNRFQVRNSVRPMHLFGPQPRS